MHKYIRKSLSIDINVERKHMDLLSSTLHVQYCIIVNITYVLSFLFRNFSFTKRKWLFHSRILSLAILNRRIINITFLLSFHLYIHIYFYFPHVDKDSKEEEENSKKSKSLSRGSIRTDLIFNQFSALISNKRNVCPSFRRSRKNFVSSSARRQVIVKNNFYTIRTRWIVRIPSCYVLANSPGCLQVSTRRNRTFDSERIIRLRQQSFIVMEEFLFSSLAFILSTENFI